MGRRASRTDSAKDPGRPFAASPEERVPLLLLGGLLILLASGLVYPAAAYPWHGFLAGGAVVVLAAIAVLFGWTKAHLAGGLPAGTLLVLALLGAWGAYWAFNAGPGTIELAWQRRGFGIVVCTAAFAAALMAAQYWELPQLSPARLLAWFLAGLTALLALWGLYQVFGPAGFPRTFRTLEQTLLLQPGAADEALQEGLLHAVRERRAASTLGAPNIFASFCVLALPPAAALALGRLRERRVVVFSCIAVLVLAAGVVASGSRGGLLALGFGAVAVACLPWLRQAQGAVAARVLAGAGVAFFLFVSIFLAAVWRLDVGESRWLGASGMTQRGYYFQTAIGIWAQEPLLGMGSGSYELLYPQFRIPGSNETRHAHSWLLEYLAEGGVVGLSLFVLLFGAALAFAGLHLAARRREGSANEWYIQAGLLAGVLALLAHGLVEYTLAFREALLALAAVAGVLAGTALRERPLVFRGQVPAVACLGFAVLLLGSGGWFAARSELPALRVYTLRAELQQAFEERADAVTLDRLAAGLVEADPRDPGAWEWAAHVSEQLDRPEAEERLQEAMRRNPFSARLREALALYYARQDDHEQAIALQEEAVELHPLSAPRWLHLARLYNDAGDRQAAVEAFRRTDGLLFPRPGERQFRSDVRRELGLPIPLEEGLEEMPNAR